MNPTDLTEEEIIQKLAKARYDSQNGLHIIPLEVFIKEEREKRKPGYKKPLGPDEIVKISRLISAAGSKNVFKSLSAQFQLFLIKRAYQK